MDLEVTFALDGTGKVSTLEIDYEGQKMNVQKLD